MLETTDAGGVLSAAEQVDALLLAHSQSLEPSLRSSLEASSQDNTALAAAAHAPSQDEAGQAAGSYL